MPLLPKYFGKRDKSSSNLEVPDTSPPKSSRKSSENVLSGLNSPSDANGSDTGHRTFSPSKKDDVYSNTKGSSSSSRLKMTMSSFKRKATVPDKFPASPRSSSSVRDSLEPPPSRTSLFMAFGRSSSSQSLPNDPSKSPYGVPQLPVIDLPDTSLFKRPSPITSRTTLPVPKTPEMRTSNTIKIFNRGSKPTRMSDAPHLELQIPSSSNQDPQDSFSLKSFRPVRPASPSPSNALDLQLPPVLSDQPRSQSPASLLPPSPVGDPRPRGSSMGSDTSQKITVAQFRQAQLESAKNRSSVHLPVPEHPSDSMPPGNIPLHMSLARPVSPSFALAAGSSASASGNESAGENGAPSRPGRLLPPQAMGRSSPIPREKTPISSSPGLRPGSTSRPQHGARLSAKWMLTSDSESESSEDTASDDATRRTSKKPPLIGDFRKLNGAKPDTSGSPYPSSFASAPMNGIAVSGSKSDLGHSSSSTARHIAKPSSLAPVATVTHVRSNSSFTPSTSSIQNIKPGQYSGGASPPSPSVMTHVTGGSVDAWSATHSAVHSHQGSSDHLFRQGQRGVAKSDLGHGGHIKRSAGVSVRRTGTVDNSLSAPSKLVASRSQSTSASTQPSPSPFSAPKAGRRVTAPAMLESDTEEEGQPSSTEDDAPLSTLLSPRRPGSGLSSQGSGSPRTSTATLPIRAQSPTRSTRSTATGLSHNSLGGLGSAPTSRTMTSPDSRKVSTNSTSPVPSERVSEPKSPLSRGRKPLIDLSSSSPTPTTQLPRSTATSPAPAISGNESSQASLLTPPMSERGFTSSPAEAAQKQSPTSPSSSFLRPGPSVIQRNHEHLIGPFTTDDSPASSVGNSSIGSGRFLNTPGTGSDAGRSIIGNSQSVITTSSGSSGNDAPRIRGGKQPSITFDDSVVFTQKKTLHRRGISGSSSGSAGDLNPYEQEAKRNERRRNEAKASVELGRVVNGPAPIDPDDDGEDDTVVLPITQNQPPNWNPWQNVSQHQQMQAMGMNVRPATPGMSPLQMNMGMNINMGNPMFNPLMSQVNMGGLMPPQQMYNPMMQAGMGMPMGFNLPPVPTMSNMMMGMDPSMMAAHQQAMTMAKHAYQMAVAQQAIAAAGDEWERSSNMGYGSVPRAPSMYGAHAGSVYGAGSLLGVGTPAGGSIWGGSVYGDAFGPAQHQHDRRQIPAMGGHYGSSLEAEDVNTRTQGRKRTVTSPSSALPPAHLRGAGAPPMPPPSSWRPS